jgi:hypothetical protein
VVNRNTEGCWCAAPRENFLFVLLSRTCVLYVCVLQGCVCGRDASKECLPGVCVNISESA